MRLLDLFCGAGGAAMGYHRAGFEVVGVDLVPQTHYPFEFHQADALEYLRRHGAEFDVIHASPPCQHASSLRHLHPQKMYPSLISPTREAMVALGRPWVIENVPGADLFGPITLCGSAFNLGAHCSDGLWHQLRRHRLFETSIGILSPACRHEGRPVGVYGNGGGNADRGRLPGINGYAGRAGERREAMGIDWMTRGELSQAIPPAYTEYIGRRVLAVLSASAASERDGIINRKSQIVNSNGLAAGPKFLLSLRSSSGGRPPILSSCLVVPGLLLPAAALRTRRRGRFPRCAGTRAGFFGSLFLERGPVLVQSSSRTPRAVNRGRAGRRYHPRVLRQMVLPGPRFLAKAAGLRVNRPGDCGAGQGGPKPSPRAGGVGAGLKPALTEDR